MGFAKDRLKKADKDVSAGESENKNKTEQQKEDKHSQSGSGSNKKNNPEEKVSVEEIERHAEFASQATGVRKDFLMGMLAVESALGQNVGECTYAEVERGAKEAHENGLLGQRAWETFKQRRETIKQLADSLGYDHEKLKVSCNPAYSVYAGTGGAMGVQQFMPDTWLEYKDRIAKIVGKENPDPWDTRDGIVAMALKVSDVPGVTQHDISAEKIASKMYLSGTTSAKYDWYANEIQYWSKNYRKLNA